VEQWEFYRHMPVYLDNGRPLGHTLEVGHAVECIHVQQGRILVRDWYIPISAVRDVTDRGVYLSVGSRDLLRNGWNVPTEAYLRNQGLVVGYEYTSRADVPVYAASSGPSNEA
jgi:hypothetical protein